MTRRTKLKMSYSPIWILRDQWGNSVTKGQQKNLNSLDLTSLLCAKNCYRRLITYRIAQNTSQQHHLTRFSNPNRNSEDTVISRKPLRYIHIVLFLPCTSSSIKHIIFYLVNEFVIKYHFFAFCLSP